MNISIKQLAHFNFNPQTGITRYKDYFQHPEQGE